MTESPATAVNITSEGFDADIAIVGAGLAGLLTAWRCLDVNPDLRVVIIERSERIGGDHTWSFNLTDIAPELHDWIAPFIAYHWDSYAVKFPKRERTLDIPYCTGNSDTLRACVQPHIDSGRLRVMVGTVAEDEAASTPTIYATGFKLREDEYPGWQKFVGRVIKTDLPHDLKNPIIMDATVEQVDGYRFVYLLPFTDREILVEDTYFSDTAELSENEISARLDDYIKAKGWEDHRVLRSEKGVLPMMMATDRNDDRAEIGLAGGFGVAATGFTVPYAVRMAEVIAKRIKAHGVERAVASIPQLRRDFIHQERYPRLLNRMFFRAARGDQRYKVLQRFYGLSENLIKRFYPNQLTWRDKLRILAGKPPVPVTKALYNFSEKAFIKREKKKRK